MRFGIRSILELTFAVALMLALWRNSVECYQLGREGMRQEFMATGVVKRPAYGAVVPLEDHINLHVITKWRPKPGKAIVEIWDCSTPWYPVLLRSIDVDVTPAIESTASEGKEPRA